MHQQVIPITILVSLVEWLTGHEDYVLPTWEAAIGLILFVEAMKVLGRGLSRFSAWWSFRSAQRRKAREEKRNQKHQFKMAQAYARTRKNAPPPVQIDPLLAERTRHELASKKIAECGLPEERIRSLQAQENEEYERTIQILLGLPPE